MLRLTAFFLISVCTLIVICSAGPQPAQVFATITRATNTPEQALNLNPTLSDDGRTIVFESSADLADTGQSASFHLLRTDSLSFAELGSTRAVCPAMSGDGRIVVFASSEDLIGRNADRNSEIFLFDGVKLKQLTETEPASDALRLSDGNFQPSISSDGRTLVFSSQGKIVIYESLERKFTRLADDGTNPKISGDGTRVYYKRSKLTADNADLVRFDKRTLTSRVVASD